MVCCVTSLIPGEWYSNMYGRLPVGPGLKVLCWCIVAGCCWRASSARRILSVQKTLQRKFKRFVSHQRDFQELLLSVLQGLVREQLRYEAMNGAPPRH